MVEQSVTKEKEEASESTVSPNKEAIINRLIEKHIEDSSK